MHESNYYRATSPARARRAALDGAIDAAVCVIGGGFAGLNTALGLAERGVRDVVLLDGHEVGHGASGRNGGFVFGGFSRDEDSLLRDLGPAHAREVYSGTTRAIELIRTRIRRHAIDCELREAGIIWANWFRDPSMLRRRQALLAEHYDAQWQWLDRDEVRRRIHSTRYHDALFEADAFHFHPLRYAQGLERAATAAGVRVFESSPAGALESNGAGWRVRTPAGEVRAAQVVLACGGYLARLRRRVDASVLPIATYVMVTEPLGPRLRAVMSTDAAVYDTRFAFDYYRPLPDTRLLWGGRISVLDRRSAAVKKLLRRDLLKVFPQLDGVNIDYAWSGLMSYARHQMPQIGEIEPGLWVAQAFGGHGVAPTTFAGELVASAIAEGDVRWKTLASPYGLASAMKPAGFAAAQISYWWAQTKDALKATSEARFNARSA